MPNNRSIRVRREMTIIDSVRRGIATITRRRRRRALKSAMHAFLACIIISLPAMKPLMPRNRHLGVAGVMYNAPALRVCRGIISHRENNISGERR